MIILAYVIAAVIPLLSLYLIFKLDLYKTGQFKMVLVSFIAGLTALGFATLVNQAVLRAELLSRDDVVRYFAPILEEILKGMILFIIVRRANFTYFVEGAIYGFAAGIGFAIFENFQYILGAPNAGLAIAISRVISTNLIHASTTGVLGIALGLARFAPLAQRWSRSLAGLVVAMLMHIAYNNLVTRVNSGLLLIFAAAAGLTAAGVIAFAIRRGLKEEKIWLEEKLGAADRVTRGEAAAVQQFEKVQELLKPLAERFGSKKAAQIERFLVIQARLGILRKTLDKLSDERMKRSVEEQMNKLRAEMDEQRRQVGAYAMLYLRHTFPEEASPLWGRLEAAIQERTASRPAAGGANLWANLQAKQQAARGTPAAKPDPEKEA